MCQALRRARDVTSKELQAVSTVAARMPPAAPAAAASHAQVETISMPAVLKV